MDSTNSGFNRKPTVYIKDTLPAKIVKKAVNDTVRINAAVSKQLSTVKVLEEKLNHGKMMICSEIEQAIESVDMKTLELFGMDFLAQLLKELEAEEAKIRNKIIGEQEVVDMYKKANLEEGLSENYVAAARIKRDAGTEELCQVLHKRETVFFGLEYLQRSRVRCKADINDVINYTREYRELFDEYQGEMKKLELLTEWQNHPDSEIIRREVRNNYWFKELVLPDT